MKALVIGGTGPTGPYVVRGLLTRSFRVTVLHRGVHEVDLPPEVEHVHADPHFAETLEQALADRTFDLVVAMYGRLRIVAGVMRKRTPRFISVGGTGVYRGWLDPVPNVRLLTPIEEDAPLQRSADPGKLSHRMVEAEQAVMEGHRAGCYNATHLRYSLVYGSGQLAPREWSILRRILDGRKRLILPEDGLIVESRGYAENMAHALLLAVDNPGASCGEVFNVRDERLLTLREWVDVICRVTNHEFELVSMPYGLATPAHPYCWPRHLIVGIDKILRGLGYRDLVPTEKAIESTVQWYLDHQPLAGGQEERQLQDAFDYEAEDRLMDAFVEASDRLRSIVPARPAYQHPYAHPTTATSN